MFSAMMLAKVFIFWFIVFPICWVNMFYRVVNCASIADLIPSFRNSFMVLNSVTWFSLGGFSMSSILICSGVGLKVFLVTDLSLVPNASRSRGWFGEYGVLLACQRSVYLES